MKKLVLAVFALGVCVTVTGASFAAGKKKTETVTASVLTDQERKVIGDKAVDTLNQQTWTIYLVLQNAKNPKIETDVLNFSGNGVSSQDLVSKGYSGSNYSLNVQNDGTPVWETVQRNAKDESIAAWRGELRGGGLNGILSIRPKVGGSMIYSFSTSMPILAPETQSAPASKKR